VDLICDLEVHECQKGFISPNANSIAEAYAAMNDDSVATRHVFGIFDGENPVGFAMIRFEDAATDPNPFNGDDQPFYLFNRFMIGKQFQGKGYGKAAAQLVIDHVKTQPYGKGACFYVCFMPENENARKLYESLGFVETGEVKWGEVVARMGI